MPVSYTHLIYQQSFHRECEECLFSEETLYNGDEQQLCYELFACRAWRGGATVKVKAIK